MSGRVDFSQACTQVVVEECHRDGAVTVLDKVKFEHIAIGCTKDHAADWPEGREIQVGDRIWLHGTRPWEQAGRDDSVAPA